MLYVEKSFEIFDGAPITGELFNNFKIVIVQSVAILLIRFIVKKWQGKGTRKKNTLYIK